jgi:hypothetical protein
MTALYAPLHSDILIFDVLILGHLELRSRLQPGQILTLLSYG